MTLISKNDQAPISPAQIAQMLLSTPQVLRSLLAPLEDDQLTWRATPDSWCIKEAIGHLINADRLAFTSRIHLILTEDTPTLTSYNAAEQAKARNDIDRSLNDLLAELENGRRKSAIWLAQLSPEQLSKTATYPPNGDFTVSDFVYEWGYHDHEHLKQISTMLRTQLFPYLGPAMQAGVEKP